MTFNVDNLIYFYLMLTGFLVVAIGILAAYNLQEKQKPPKRHR